jgi:ABC-type transport system involved in multi-copper enzyme maturation permease subunit
MTQTLAIFLEAYRSLNSKKLFWIVLVLSGLVAACFACVGINEHGVKLIYWQVDLNFLNTTVVPADQFYKSMYYEFGVNKWLSWVASILALISTAGIFPDLMTAGSIDLYVSKPISRLRLFFTQYLAGLLFAALQVTVFSTACFLVMGLRGGVWEPRVFLAVPFVVLFFSYLFSVCVLVGVTTRSTVAAILLTLLFWFTIGGIDIVENFLLLQKTMERHGTSFAAVQMEQHDRASRPHGGSNKPLPTSPADQSLAAEANASKESSFCRIAHGIAYGLKTVLPKTGETVALLQRSLIEAPQVPQSGSPQERRMLGAQQEVIDTIRSRSVTWVLGTSLGFEAVVLCFAAFIFCRRDY